MQNNKRDSMEYALSLRVGGNNHRITIVCYVKLILNVTTKSV